MQFSFSFTLSFSTALAQTAFYRYSVIKPCSAASLKPPSRWPCFLEGPVEPSRVCLEVTVWLQRKLCMSQVVCTSGVQVQCPGTSFEGYVFACSKMACTAGNVRLGHHLYQKEYAALSLWFPWGIYQLKTFFCRKVTNQYRFSICLWLSAVDYRDICCII